MFPTRGRKHPQQEFLQVDTTNILFICGGAFAGLDKLIESRGKGSSIGFGAKVKNYKEQPLSETEKIRTRGFNKIWAYTRIYRKNAHNRNSR